MRPTGLTIRKVKAQSAHSTSQTNKQKNNMLTGFQARSEPSVIVPLSSFNYLCGFNPLYVAAHPS